MNDRELLEMAAKAFGVGPIIAHVNGGVIIGPACRARLWLPLTDDGDALRLAVKLDISVLAHFPLDAVVAFDGGRRIIEKKDTFDPMPAIRRAITRAAAEIGRAMP